MIASCAKTTEMSCKNRHIVAVFRRFNEKEYTKKAERTRLQNYFNLSASALPLFIMSSALF